MSSSVAVSTTSSSSILDLVAGKRQAPPSDTTSQPDFWARLSLPPAPSLSLPNWLATSSPEGISLPSARTLSLPSWVATNKAETDEHLSPSAPTLSLPSWFAANKTETDERFLDSEDQADDDMPVWAKVKDQYQHPKLPLVFVHGLAAFMTHNCWT
jgi:hypothetical protein